MREKTKFISTFIIGVTLAGSAFASNGTESRIVLGMIETDNPEFPPIPVHGVVAEDSQFLGLEFMEGGKMRFFSVEDLRDEPNVKKRRGFGVVRAAVNERFDKNQGGTLKFKFRGNLAGTHWLKDTKPISRDQNGEWKVWCSEQQPCQKVMIKFNGGMFPVEMGFE